MYQCHPPYTPYITISAYKAGNEIVYHAILDDNEEKEEIMTKIGILMSIGVSWKLRYNTRRYNTIPS